MKITVVLTDNGEAFTDRLFGLRQRAATGQHEFGQLCADLGIERRFTPPMRPQTNGMGERFNSRIEDALQSHRFQSGEDLEQTILRYIMFYNQQLPQAALASKIPLREMKERHKISHELFKKQLYYLTGSDYRSTLAHLCRRGGGQIIRARF